MMPVSLHITYRKGRPFAAYIYLNHKPGEKSARTEEITPDLLVDFADSGRPLGIEIMTPEAVSVDEVNALLIVWASAGPLLRMYRHFRLHEPQSHVRPIGTLARVCIW